MSGIDVHVLTHEGTNPEWLDKCLDSLAGEPCTTHVIDNRGLTVGEGRARGYAQGGHEFVAHVDSDDWVLPGVFDVVLEALRNHRSVCTMELVMYEGKRFFRGAQPAHHLFAARREDIAPLLPHVATMPYLADKLIMRHMKPHQLNFIGYAWRLHSEQAHRKINSDMVKHEIARLPW